MKVTANNTFLLIAFSFFWTLAPSKEVNNAAPSDYDTRKALRGTPETRSLKMKTQGKKKPLPKQQAKQTKKAKKAAGKLTPKSPPLMNTSKPSSTTAATTTTNDESRTIGTLSSTDVSTVPNDSSSPPTMKRIVIQCNPEWTMQQCVDHLRSVVSAQNIRIIHKNTAGGINRLAISINASMIPQLLDSGFQMYEEHRRDPLFVIDSASRPHDSRRMQTDSQTVPYGIDMVQARQVWQLYGVRGSNVTLCILDTGGHNTHPDFAGTSLAGYTGTGHQRQGKFNIPSRSQVFCI